MSLLSACGQSSPAPPPHDVAVSKECSLVFIDSFDGSHGPTVQKTSESLGGLDSVYRLNQSDKVQGELPFKALTKKIGVDLGTHQLSADQASSVLDNYIVNLYTKPMQLLTSLMQDANGLGVSHSALNISLGLNKLSTVHGAESHSENSIYQANLDRALGLAPGAAAKERKQALLDRVDRVMEGSREVKEARIAWREAVKDFESGHNSVVVSAGNDGGDARSLAAQGYHISPDVDQNFLAVPEVTTVGATGWGSSLAGYSRLGDEVDILANGSVDWLTKGTSFSAPRVSAAMRGAHCQNPEFTSDQAQDFVTHQLSAQHSFAGKQRPVLDLAKTEQFLSVQ